MITIDQICPKLYQKRNYGFLPPILNRPTASYLDIQLSIFGLIGLFEALYLTVTLLTSPTDRYRYFTGPLLTGALPLVPTRVFQLNASRVS